jgi:hypothetical protein
VTSSGSVLVSWGGLVQPVFGEYTLLGEPIMEIAMVGGGSSYRIIKEPAAAFSRDVLRQAAGGNLGGS